MGMKPRPRRECMQPLDQARMDAIDQANLDRVLCPTPRLTWEVQQAKVDALEDEIERLRVTLRLLASWKCYTSEGALMQSEARRVLK